GRLLHRRPQGEGGGVLGIDELGDEVVEHGAQVGAQAAGGGELGVQLLTLHGRVGPQRLDEQRLLAAERGVEAAAREAGVLEQVAHRGAFVAAPAEQLHRLGHHLLFVVLLWPRHLSQASMFWNGRSVSAEGEARGGPSAGPPGLLRRGSAARELRADPREVASATPWRCRYASAPP